MKLIRGNEIDLIPASHEDPKNPGVLKRVLAVKTDLLRGHVQMVNWSRLPAGSSFQSHDHEDMQDPTPDHAKSGYIHQPAIHHSPCRAVPVSLPDTPQNKSAKRPAIT